MTPDPASREHRRPQKPWTHTQRRHPLKRRDRGDQSGSHSSPAGPAGSVPSPTRGCKALLSASASQVLGRCLRPPPGQHQKGRSDFKCVLSQSPGTSPRCSRPGSLTVTRSLCQDKTPHVSGVWTVV